MWKQLQHGGIFCGPGGKFSASAAQSSSDGVPRQRYIKDLMRTGDFVKVGKDRVQSFTVTPERLKHWADTTNAFIAAGNKVSIPQGHDLTGNADKNRGYVLSAFVRDGILYGEVEMIGEDGIAAAARSEVSIYSPPDFTDGNGKKWDWPILHVALTTTPVINRQQGFVPIAASQGDPIEVPVLEFKERVRNQPPKEQTMKWKELALKLGIDASKVADDITDEAGEALVLSHFEDAKTKAVNPAKVSDLESQLTRVRAENKTLSGRVAELEPIKLDRNTEAVSVRKIDDDFNSLIADGKITPAVRDALRPIVCSGSYMLDLNSAEEDATDCRAFQIIDALKKNDPKDLKEKTKSQTIAASRETPGEDDKAKSREAATKEIDAIVASHNDGKSTTTGTVL